MECEKHQMVAGKIFRVILALAVKIVGGLPDDVHAISASALVMGIDIFHPDHDPRI